VCRQTIERYTSPGSLVLDPFCGVGTIPLAAKLEGRRAIGIERSVRFADDARARLLAEATDDDGDESVEVA